VDGTTYKTLEAAIEALPSTGGTVVISSDTAMPVKDTVTLPTKSGKVTVMSNNGSSLVIGYRLKLGCDMEFDNIKIVNASTSEGSIFATGHELVFGSGVTTDRTNGSSRWPSLYGGDTDTATAYDTHLVVRGGTWRNIFGGNRNKTLTGNTLVELSNVSFGGNLSAKNESGTHSGTAELVLDLRSGKTVTGGIFKMDPTSFLVDGGHVAELNGKTYSQVPVFTGPVYVDGTGATVGAYTTLTAAITTLSDLGGSVIVSGDTAVGTVDAAEVLPAGRGKITLSGADDVTLTVYGLRLSGDLALENITLSPTSASSAIFVADGVTLTVADTVETAGAPLTVEIGKDGTAIVAGTAVTVTAAENYELVVNGNTYTTQRIKGTMVGYISNANGNDNNDGLSDTKPKATQGKVDGKGLRALMYGGGTIVVCGNFNISSNEDWNYGGKVTVTADFGGKDYKNQAANTGIFKLASDKTLSVNSYDLVLDDILFQPGTDSVISVTNGAAFTVTDTVEVVENTLVVVVGANGTAIVENDAVTVKAAAGFELVKDGHTYTVRKLPVTGYISNASGNDNNDGLTDETPKQNQGKADGKGIRNLLYGVGGTIVVCGNFNISSNETWDYGGDVTVTGVYGGKDYKDQNANTGIFKLNGGKTLTVDNTLTFDDVLFLAGENSVLLVPAGATLIITESVQMLEDTLTILVEEGGTASVASGRYARIYGDGDITVTHCTHAEVTEGVATASPTCAQNGVRYDRCNFCGLHIRVSLADQPIDPTAHDIRWTYGETAAVAVCAHGCGYTATHMYSEITVSQLHVSSSGDIDGDFSAEKPINDFGAAMAVAAAQDTDVTVYIHDYAVIPNSGAHSSWNAYAEPAHTNTITVCGYKDLAVLRFNNDSESNVLVYALSGPTTFENLEFSSWGSTEETAFYMVARHNKLVLGKSLSTDLYHKGSNAFNIIGGCFYTDLSPAGGCAELGTDLSVLSGNYTNIYAGAYFNSKCCVDTQSGGDVHLTVGGNITVRRQIRVGNHGDDATYANMNDAHIDIVGPVAVMRYFVFGPSRFAYSVQNVYLKLYDGFVRVGEELGNMGELGYEWGSAAYGEPITARISGKLYVYGNSASVSAMGMYTGLVGNLTWDSANNGKWEAIVMDEAYCSVNRGAHTPLGDAIEHLDATCTADGYDLYTCADCGKTYAEKIERLPHSYGDGTVLAATCIAPEMKKAVCTACGDARHTVIGTVYADHTDPEKTGYCQVCNKDLTVDCPHENVTVTPVTSGCGSGEKLVCADCGKTEVQITGDGHKYGAYAVTVEPTATTAGAKTRTCRVCGKVETAWINAGNAASATAMAVDASGKLADFSVASMKLSKAEKEVLDALLQQNAYGSEVKVSYETDGDVVKNVFYMIPVPAEYTEYENIRVVVREEDGTMHYVYFEIDKGYIVFTF